MPASNRSQTPKKSRKKQRSRSVSRSISPISPAPKKRTKSETIHSVLKKKSRTPSKSTKSASPKISKTPRKVKFSTNTKSPQKKKDSLSTEINACNIFDTIFKAVSDKPKEGRYKWEVIRSMNKEALVQCFGKHPVFGHKIKKSMKVSDIYKILKQNSSLF